MTYGWRAAIAESQPWDLAVTLHVWKPGTDGRPVSPPRRWRHHLPFLPELGPGS